MYMNFGIQKLEYEAMPGTVVKSIPPCSRAKCMGLYLAVTHQDMVMSQVDIKHYTSLHKQLCNI